MDTNYLSVKDAAEVAKANIETIYRAFRRGSIRGYRERGRVYLERESFECWKLNLEVYRSAFLIRDQIKRGEMTAVGA